MLISHTGVFQAPGCPRRPALFRSRASWDSRDGPPPAIRYAGGDCARGRREPLPRVQEGIRTDHRDGSVFLSCQGQGSHSQSYFGQPPGVRTYSRLSRGYHRKQWYPFLAFGSQGDALHPVVLAAPNPAAFPCKRHGVYGRFQGRERRHCQGRRENGPRSRMCGRPQADRHRWR